MRKRGLRTERLHLRPLTVYDFAEWSEVRLRCADWLTKWEPLPASPAPDPSHDQTAFANRCNARRRDYDLGSGFAFGMWHDYRFCGEINLSNVVRGAFQSAHVGYWIDQRLAGRSLMPEGLLGIFDFAFDAVGLHRLQISIVPRNTASRRVVDKLGIRPEGIAKGYLQIAGRWEDHVHYGIVAEEWAARRAEMHDRLARFRAAQHA